MERHQEDQINHYLKEFVRLSNSFDDQNEEALRQYWRGQIFGICKILDLLELKLKINKEYYLEQLH